MEVISNGIFNLMKRQWRRRKYSRLDSAVENRKNIKIVRFGGKVKRRVWKLRKLRFKFSSPLNLWKKFKNAYMNMMLKLSSSVSALNTGGSFGTKRIPKARTVPLAYNKTEFENRLVYEIYKSLVVSMELNTR